MSPTQAAHGWRFGSPRLVASLHCGIPSSAPLCFSQQPPVYLTLVKDTKSLASTPVALELNFQLAPKGVLQQHRENTGPGMDHGALTWANLQQCTATERRERADKKEESTPSPEPDCHGYQSEYLYWALPPEVRAAGKKAAGGMKTWWKSHGGPNPFK